MNFQIVPISLAAYMSGETQRLSCKSWELLTIPRMLFSVTFFGKKEGSNYTEGLVDSTSNGMYNTVFDARTGRSLMSRLLRWKNLYNGSLSTSLL